MKKLTKKMQKQFDLMCKSGKLFKSSVSGRQVWDLYLKTFTDEDNPVFRDPESSSHNCNHCNNFVKRYGNVVAIDENYKIMTIFDIEMEDDSEYKKSLNVMSKVLKAAEISDVFKETFVSLNSLPYEKCNKTQNTYRLGIDKNVKRYTKEEAELYGVVKENETIRFNHFYLDMDKDFVDFTGKSIESLQAEYRSNKQVFMRGMEEITLDTLMLVRDLIIQGSLLNGDAHLSKVETMIKFAKVYKALDVDLRDNWCWVNSYEMGLAKFKNELIGVLCSELSEGEELNKACSSWNKRVDPANYMKAVAPITENQKKMAQAFVEENGYVESFDRRLAVLDDIKVNEIRHINVGDGEVASVSIFDNVKPVKSIHKRNKFEGIEEVGIEKFMKDILPGCSSVEVFLENKHQNNLVTMTTSKDENCKQMFKWDNPYSWTYKGNLAGKSMIKEAVKSQGGGVDGVLRASIMWSEKDSMDNSDLDLHCIEPSGGAHIMYSRKYSTKTGGTLDIDITQPINHKSSGKDVVENITYPSVDKMIDGVYKIFVRQYAARNSKGFKAEIEFGDEIFEYSYDNRVSGDVQIAEVKLKDGEFSIKHLLPCGTSSKEIYGLNTKEFHKVNLMCLSPNHWGKNKAGNKHYFFMIDKCKADSSIRSFHSENLEPELAKHRKVLEVLGAVNMLEPGDKQLSGLGFNSTVKDDVILRLQGNFKRTIRIKF